MGCKTVALPGGATAIVCTRGRRQRHRCGWCTTPASFQCDAPVPDPVQEAAAKAGFHTGPIRTVTCDKHLCPVHATEVGTDRHHCPAHTVRP